MTFRSFNVQKIYLIKTLKHSVLSTVLILESSNEIYVERRKCHVLISIQTLYISTTVLHESPHITLGLPVISGEVKQFIILFLYFPLPLNKYEYKILKKTKLSTVKEEVERAKSGAHHQEPATIPYSCHGVFTDRSIFSLNLSRIQILTGTSVTNCNHKRGLMSTSRNDVDTFT